MQTLEVKICYMCDPGCLRTFPLFGQFLALPIVPAFHYCRTVTGLSLEGDECSARAPRTITITHREVLHHAIILMLDYKLHGPEIF